MKGNLLTRLLKKCSISLLCLALVITTLTGTRLQVNAATVNTVKVGTVADPNTSANWSDYFRLSKVSGSYNNMTSYNNFIQKVGAVYVDKSVSKIDQSSDFNITFSALQSAFSYSTNQVAKALGVDVVLVLDNSNSMRMASGASGDANLLETMVKASDALLKQILSIDNSSIRIGIVTYNSTATTILEFNEYKEASITYSSTGINAVGITPSDEQISGYTGNGSGTNTQSGIDAGMNILANATDTEGRIPVVVVLTDGEANRATTQTWYNITQSSTTSSSRPVALATILNAAYNKARIEDNYTAAKPTVYGIGLNLDNNARVVIDPKNYFTSNSASTTGRDAYNNGYTKWVNSTGQITYSNNRFNQLPSNSSVTKQDVIDNINYVDHYSDAGSTDLSDVFQTIGESIKELASQNLDYSITNEQVYESTTQSTPLTYIDPLGDYMMVKSINSVKLFGQTYNVVRGEGYTSESTNSQFAYGHIVPYRVVDSNNSQNFTLTNDFGHKVPVNEDLEIYVRTNYNLDANGAYADFEQELVVKADKEAISALILKLTYTTNDQDEKILNANGIEFNADSVSPLQVDYTVGLIDDVLTKGIDALSEEYIKNHLNEETNQVSFYTNKFTGNNKAPNGSALGDATASFYAAETNGYYYITEDYFKNHYHVDEDAYYIYSSVSGNPTWSGNEGDLVRYTPYTSDMELTKLTSNQLSDSTKVYALVTRTQLVETSDGIKLDLSTFVRQLPWSDVKDCVEKKSGTNNYILKAPHLRHAQFLDTAVSKTDNNTNTSNIVHEILQGDEAHDHEITAYFGNNGLVTIGYTTEVKVTKIWDDNNNQDGKRPSSITVNLLANGEVAATATVLAQEDWSYTFTNLPVFKNKERIVYTVSEEAVAGYETTIDGYTITNKHVPETINIVGEKTWSDDNDRDRIRPVSVLIRLLADGAEVMHAVVNAESEWKYAFNNLPKYANGKEISYTLLEDPVEGYTPTYDGYNTLNTHVPQKVEVAVEKVWDDGNNQDGIRPNEITVELLADGTKVKETKLSAANNWKYTFEDLPKNNQGVEIVYTVKEVAVEGYQTSINGHVITNTYTPKTTEITVNKQWSDNNDKYGLRPEIININLLANGQKVQEATVKESEGWTYTFTNLPLNQNGQKIQYTVTEDAVEGYTSSIDGYTITNTLKTTNIPVSKVWNDNNNQDGKRPSSITVTLNAHIHVNEEKQDVDLDLTSDAKTITATITADGNWQYTFKDLPVSVNGHIVVYNVKETAVQFYDSYVTGNATDGFVVTNSHETDTTVVPVRKVWDDKDNQDGIRPSQVTVHLYDGETLVNTVELNNANHWAHTFTSDKDGTPLQKNRNGSAITYTIKEDAVSKYTPVYDQSTHTVTNVYKPETTQVSVEKVWDDENNRFKTRPEFITIRLLADGIQVDEVKLNSLNEFSHTFTDLPKKAKGKDIVYTLSEDAVHGYKTTINGNKITNTLETTDLIIKKIWDDKDNQDGIRPKSIRVTLYADGVEKTTVELNEGNSWSWSFTDIPKFTSADGTIEIVYTISETKVEGYTSTIDGYTIKNTHIPETTEVTVNKQWDDNNNQDGIRPSAIEVNLLADGTVVKTTNISSDQNGNWTYTFTNLPKYANGKEIVYTVTENAVEGYVTHVDGFTFTNKHTPEVTEVTVDKVWDDNNNQDGIRPTTITVNLYADGEKINEATLDASKEWKHTFINLPKYANGKEIVYAVDENLVEGYVASIEGTTITNTHTPEVTYVRVNKVWNDNNNQDGIRPSTITVALLANGQKVQEATVSATDGWLYVFTNLPKYENGKEINYTVKEVGTPSGYSALVSGHTITNTHKPATKSLTVTKVWNDNNNQDGIRPEQLTVYLYADDVLVKSVKLTQQLGWKYTFTDLPVKANGKVIEYTIGEDLVAGYDKDINNDNYTLTNTHETETTQIKVTKVWDDNNDVDKYRPTSVTVTLDGHVHINGQRRDVDLNLDDDSSKTLTAQMTVDGNWEYVFENLPVYHAGHQIIYNITETPVDKYDVYVTGSAAEGFVVTNSRESDKVSIPVRKVWDDHGNQDGIRPSEVIIDLLANGVKVNEVTLNDTNHWTYVFTQMPKNDQNGTIVYTIEEHQVDNRYTPVYDQKTHTVTNVYTPEVTSVTVNKTWANENSKFETRPESITIRLFANGVEISSAVIDEYDDWSHTFSNLPKKANAKDIVYTVKEDAVAGYKTTINGFEITNTLETVEVNVNKVWDDNNNQDGIRPATITVHLLANGKVVDSAIVSQDNNWEYTFAGLPKQIDGNQVVYTLKEDAVAGYTNKISGNMITNTHIPQVTDITVNKQWDDNNNQDGIRPATITVSLYANDEVIKTVTVKATDEWKYTFENLPVYENGNKIRYTVSEKAVDGYETSVDGFTITNKHVPATKEITVNKVWNDNNNQDGIRPTAVHVDLLANDKVVKTIVLGEPNWAHTFTNLPVYENGVEIVYTVDEHSVDGYSTSINDYTITNTHNPETTSIDVTKKWDDSDNDDGKRPTSITVTLDGHIHVDGARQDVDLLPNSAEDAITVTISADANGNWKHQFTNLPVYYDGHKIVYSVTETPIDDYETYVTGNPTDGFVITNSRNRDTTSIQVRKVWDDRNNQDGIRPESVLIYLKANGTKVQEVTLSEENHWTHVFENIPKNKDGEPIEFTIEEVNVDSRYEAVYDQTTHTVTNIYTPEVTSVQVNKTWANENSQYNTRPESITVNLYASGEKVREGTLNDQNDWSFTFEGLPKKANGRDIVYTVKEETVIGYVTTINGYEITNTLETVNVSINKVWDDANNQDGIRPEIITVHLLADGKVVETAKVSASDNWQHTFVNLPKFLNGQEVTYKVSEEAVEGYETHIDGYKITNRHVPATKEITVNKQWDDNNNQDGIRPREITVHLYADGEKVDQVTINATQNWAYTFENLPVYKEGKEIVYTVKEDTVNGYETIIDGFNITNKHVPETTSITVNKYWDDNNDQDGIRPTMVTVYLKANGEVVKTITLEKDNWSYTVSHLPVYKDGERIEYTVSEEAVEGYEASVDGFNITNKHVPETTNITVHKQWDDNNNQDGIRPEEITVYLYADGEVIETVIITSADEWTHTFNDLPVYEMGEKIVYAVREQAVDGYETIVDGFNITNKHIPETTDITVNKIWDDNNNQDGLRPETITVSLLADGVVIQTVTIDSTNWAYTFNDLPVYKDGVRIEYTVNEEVVEGYEATVDGFDITNKHTPATTEITVNKTWVDANNQDGIRPEEITVYLYADGEVIETVTIKAADNWTYTFTELPVYKDGVEIVYTVSEDDVEGYAPTIDGFDITNTHEVEKVQVHVVKVWDDKDNKDKLRPESITVHLYADGKIYATAVVTAESGWTYDFTDLDKYRDNGTPIIYTLYEEPVKGYTTTIDANVITNTHKVKIVDTGDNTDITLWVSSMIISLLGMVFISKKKEEEF